MSTVVPKDSRRGLLFLGFVGLIFVLVAPGTRDIAAQPKDDGFIFSSNSVFSALDHSQSLRLGERLTFAQIEGRLHSYKVERSHDCEGECIHVVGRNGVYLELNSGEPITSNGGRAPSWATHPKFCNFHSHS
jgi:hypothetical protein